MREFKRKKSERQLPRLIRGADGRLRATNATNDDIGDIWAEQRRIKLQEAIEEDKRRAVKQAARKARWHKLLKRGARKGGSGSPLPGASGGKTLQRVSLKRRPRLPKIHKKQYLIAGGLAGIVVAGFIGLQILGGDEPQKSTTREVLRADEQAPQYKTVLPIGKTVEQLGGWRLVSPPGKPPVFAYVDEIEGVHIRVSQQPLPQSFKEETAAKLAELAEQFNAQEKLTAGDTTVYVGTSIKGPQSAVLSKKNLLILISADARLTTKQWTEYIWLLQ